MAWRAIQDTVGASESLGGLSHLSERLYWRLLAHSDPYGRLVCSPRKLRAKCYPLVDVTDEAAGAALLELEQADRIRVYRPATEWVLQLVDFEKNQPREAYRKRPDPALPEPPNKPTEGGVLEAFAAVIHSSGVVPDTFRSHSGVSPEIPASGELPETFRKPSGPEGEETETETENEKRKNPLLNPPPVARPPAREPDQPPPHTDADTPELIDGGHGYLIPQPNPGFDLQPIGTVTAQALAAAKHQPEKRGT